MGCGCGSGNKTVDRASSRRWEARFPDGHLEVFGERNSADDAARKAWYAIGRNVPPDAIKALT